MRNRECGVRNAECGIGNEEVMLKPARSKGGTRNVGVIKSSPPVQKWCPKGGVVDITGELFELKVTILESNYPVCPDKKHRDIHPSFPGRGALGEDKPPRHRSGATPPLPRRGAFVFLLIAAVWMLAACETPELKVEVAKPEMRQVTDDLGRIVTIPVNVTRVVSLAPNLTENIFAVGAGERLVGVTTFCNYPEQAKAIAKIGDTMNPNIETIIALKPDIVFVSTASQIQAFLKTLEANKIAVYVSDSSGLRDLSDSLQRLGDVFGTNEKTSELLKDLWRREDNVRTSCGTYYYKPDSKRIFVQISKEPLFTIGEAALLNDVIQAAGGRSVTANIKTAYPKLSKETALALDPDVIILSESEDNLEPNEVFRNSDAVKNGRVYKINADLLSRPGPRILDVLEIIARDLGCAGQSRER